jgi:hypothetical protein
MHFVKKRNIETWLELNLMLNAIGLANKVKV